MSVNGIRDYSPIQGSLAGKPAAAAAGEGTDFLTTLKLSMADFKSQTLGTLISASPAASLGAQDVLGMLGGAGNGPAASLEGLLGTAGGAQGLSATGRNTALFDPESAYRMMTTINGKEVDYKAELSEMGDMGAYVSTLRQEGGKLGSVDAATSGADIESRLEAFADAYNGWIARFRDDLQPGGLLAGTQAATVSRRELEESIRNFFNGAKDGLHGMGDLGLTIDPATHLASLDKARLASVVASNRTGVVDAIQDFSANFAKSAELLNSDGNFIANRMGNLSRAISFIGSNKASLQAEFGLGDPAKPRGQAAKALANYSAVHGLEA